MRKRTLALILVAVAIVLGYFLQHAIAGHTTPAGQARLTELTPVTFETLKDDFNSASSEPRVILLLSPT